MCRSPSAVRRPVVQNPIETVSPRPKAGRSPVMTLKIMMRRVPIRKVGSDIPRSVAPSAKRERTLSGRSAVRIPIGIPETSAIRTARPASSTVAGRRSRMRSATGAPCRRLIPKSPARAFPRNRRYCTRGESLRPSASVSAARSAAVASGGSICETGSPTN